MINDVVSFYLPVLQVIVALYFMTGLSKHQQCMKEIANYINYCNWSSATLLLFVIFGAAFPFMAGEHDSLNTLRDIAVYTLAFILTCNGGYFVGMSLGIGSRQMLDNWLKRNNNKQSKKPVFNITAPIRQSFTLLNRPSN